LQMEMMWKIVMFRKTRRSGKTLPEPRSVRGSVHDAE